jgi:hypothetical protein
MTNEITSGALAKLFDVTPKTIADLAKRDIIVSGSKSWSGARRKDDAWSPPASTISAFCVGKSWFGRQGTDQTSTPKAFHLTRALAKPQAL